MDKFRQGDKWLNVAFCFAEYNDGVFYTYKKHYSRDKEKLLRKCIEKEHSKCEIKEASLSRILTNIRTSAFQNGLYFNEYCYNKGIFHLTLK